MATSCREEARTPDWEGATEQPDSEAVSAEPASGTSPRETEAAGDAERNSTTSSEQSPVDSPNPSSEATADPAQEPPAIDQEVTPSELRFVAYNVKNYLTMETYRDGKRTTRFKPESEIQALVTILVNTRPDVIGLCEIGTPEDLNGLRKRLSEAGLELRYAEHSGGADDTRHQALLSRFPIVARNSQRDLSYKLLGKEAKMRRGILDATVQAADKKIRFLGVHLKSKREIPEGDQELIRRNEAYLLRRHVDRILDANPAALLCVYGDLNDTRRSTAVRSVQGPFDSPRYLEPLHLVDSRGELWTHFWSYQQVYSRFDYIMVSKALRPLVDNEAGRIIDDPEWAEASDHRPLLGVFQLN